MYILMPCAGLYSRFPQGELPKYVKPMTDMRPMFSWAVKDVKRWTDEPICVAVRKSDEDQFHVSEILHEFEDVRIMILDHETQGSAHTVYEMLNYFKIDEPFLVHDCDCSWTPKYWNKKDNLIAVGWRETAIGDRSSKSWIFIKGNMVERIEEKKNVSDWYSCGGYQFSSPHEFKRTFEMIRQETKNEIYNSQVIQRMICAGKIFFWEECENLADWGTYEKYVNWRQQSKVFFIDLDGTICKAQAPYGKDTWDDEMTVLPGAIEKLQEIKKNNGYIIITTGRTTRRKSQNQIRDLLFKNKIPFDDLITDVPFGVRYLVNDYAKSNPYPTTLAINTKRNSADWIEKV